MPGHILGGFVAGKGECFIDVYFIRLLMLMIYSI